MSRTDAHVPYWVQRIWAAEDSAWYSSEWHSCRWRAWGVNAFVECDLHEDSIRHPSSESGKRRQHCSHEIRPHDRFFSRPSIYGWERRYYWGKQRARVRRLVKTEQYDKIEPTRTRHSVAWDLS